MADILTGLKPDLLWKHFTQILKRPHCSGNEKALGNYIITVAKELRLPWRRDRVGNVLVDKPASPGHEKASGVILQGHLDMVCEKNSDTAHDFSKDAISPEIKGEWVQARGTTLGSDNGIGIASALAVMEDRSLTHGPLEFLFTVDEETGLTGANKLAKGFLKGSRLLNLDSEEEGTFTIGCSGGADSELTITLERKKRRLRVPCKLKISGFRGGHSGLDINQGRGNAIRLLARLLDQAQDRFSIELVRIEGGNKRNAIPRECWAEFYVEKDAARRIAQYFKGRFAEIRNEYKSVEKEAQLFLEKIDDCSDEPLTLRAQATLVRLLLTLPHGVVSMHPEIEGLVETSTNLAIVHCQKNFGQIVCSSRSSIASALGAVRQEIKAAAELAGARTAQPPGYPGWEPDLQSELLARLLKVYETTFGKEPAIKAVHAGLECGIIGEKFPGMDMISFGPTIEHPHSPEERVHVGSVERFWKFLTKALHDLA